MNKLTLILLTLTFSLQAQIKLTRPNVSFGFSGGTAEAEVEYNDLADSLFERMSTTPSDSLKYILSMDYDSLEYYNILDTLDFLYCFAMLAEDQALLDLKRTTKTATNVSSTAFTAREGFTGDASADYINLEYNPSSDAVKYTVNECSYGVYCLTDGQSNNVDMSMGGSSGYLYVRNTGDDIKGRINSGTLSGYGIATAQGFTALRKTNATTIQYVRNSTISANEAVSTVAIANNPATVLCYYVGSPSLYTNRTIAWSWGGSSMSTNQYLKLFEIIERHMDYFGKGVVP